MWPSGLIRVWSLLYVPLKQCGAPLQTTCKSLGPKGFRYCRQDSQAHVSREVGLEGGRGEICCATEGSKSSSHGYPAS